MHDMTRRATFGVAGLGALAGFASLAAAAEKPAAMTPAEQANLKVVDAFCESWTAKDYDPDKVAAKYLAADSSVRILESLPFAVGPAAVATVFKQFMTPGMSVKVDTRWRFAKGPVVVNHRMDTIVTPGQADKFYEMVGVFMVKDGKITEWTDYLVAQT